MEWDEVQDLEYYYENLKRLYCEANKHPANKYHTRLKQRDLSGLFGGVYEKAREETQFKNMVEEIKKMVAFFNQDDRLT